MTSQHQPGTMLRRALGNFGSRQATGRVVWGRGLSFDQAASHKSSIKPHGRALPFNAVCFQPGAAGIDMFRCLQSWVDNINYVFPPAPMTGRLITFLPSTSAKTIVVLPLPTESAWWSYAVLPGAKGLIHRSQAHGFAVLAFDFSLSGASSGRWTPLPFRGVRASHVCL